MGGIKLSRKQLFISITLIIAGIFLMGSILMGSGVKKKLIIEVGDKSLGLSDFINGDSTKYELITRLEDIDFESTGEIPVQIKYKEKNYESKLVIVDTTAPLVKTSEVGIIVNDKEPLPEDFVEEVFDYSDFTISYKELPDFTHIGEQEIFIVVEDSFANVTEAQSLLTIYDIEKSIEVELGQYPTIGREKFLKGIDYDLQILTDISSILGSPVGEYKIDISIDGYILEGAINIADTTAPEASVKGVESFQNIKLDASEFVFDVIDESDYRVEYKYEPDYAVLGEQEVTLLIVDQYDNTSEYKTTLTVKKDTEPPVITGVKDIIAYLGKSISYKSGVEVRDNSMEDIELVIDSSKVNPREKGTYEVLYRARDRAGNTTEKRATVTVVGLVVSEEEFNGILDGILKRILNDGMGEKEKAHAIYKWTKGHIAYTGFSEKGDWKNEAYRGIKNAKGDCFTYFSVAKALLTRVGIDNLDITRLGGATEHYWNLVNIDGDWYHFDATRNNDRKETFMLTDAELEAINKTRNNYYYKYDESLYPRTP
ncbi:MAG: transglutaminase domain-containing protein [Tissierellaceae bacterium]